MQSASAASGEHVECPALTLIAGAELRDSPEKLMSFLWKRIHVTGSG
jgi:hypothetical protein